MFMAEYPETIAAGKLAGDLSAKLTKWGAFSESSISIGPLGHAVLLADAAAKEVVRIPSTGHDRSSIMS